jgi:hypothetical protein
MEMGELLAVGVLFGVVLALCVWNLSLYRDYRAAAKKLMALQFANPYGRLLGRVVEAKVYEASEWERMVVVAVSWRGAVAVRPEKDVEARARWICKDLVAERVRGVDDEREG